VDVVRSIIISWLAEKSLISTVIKRKIDQNMEKGLKNE